MNSWLLVSNLTLMFFRFTHYYGQALSGDEAELHPNWEKTYKLRMVSKIIVYLLFPFYVTWTIIGTQWFV
jgi:hypothetical protein